MSPLARRMRTVLPPVVVAVAFLTAWELFVVARDIKPFLLPKPSFIAENIAEQWSGMWEAARNTGTNALVGLVSGTVAGVVMAFVANRFRVFREMFSPLAAAVNAMPIVALTPMFNNLFSITSTTPRRLVVTIIVFFPVFLNVLRGLTQVDPGQVELLRSYAAREATVLRTLRVPNALPFLFTGLKVSASLSVISAIVAEYLGGPQNGLGNRITSAASNSAYGRAWAYVAAACVMGLLFYAGAYAAERLAMPWRAKRAAAQAG